MRTATVALALLALTAVVELVRRWRIRRAAKAVIVQAETVTYLAALARLQPEDENR